MLLTLLLCIPLLGIFTILAGMSYDIPNSNNTWIKKVGITTSIINLVVSLLIFFLFDYSSNQFQFVKEYFEISYFDFYLGIDGLSIYFVLLTTIITPIALLSN
jgi:NADH:ubiquinone oxidoreductase subunit 4 (subunit M)